MLSFKVERNELNGLMVLAVAIGSPIPWIFCSFGSGIFSILGACISGFIVTGVSAFLVVILREGEVGRLLAKDKARMNKERRWLDARNPVGSVKTLSDLVESEITVDSTVTNLPSTVNFDSHRHVSSTAARCRTQRGTPSYSTLEAVATALSNQLYKSIQAVYGGVMFIRSVGQECRGFL